MKLLTFAAAVALSAFPALADVWLTSENNDPFEDVQTTLAIGGMGVGVRDDSVIVFTCASDGDGLVVKAFLDMRYSDGVSLGLVDMQPSIRLAVDDTVLDLQITYGISLENGNGNIGFEFEILTASTPTLIAALKSAKDSVAMKVDLFNAPTTVSATGSTDAAQALSICLAKQGLGA